MIPPDQAVSIPHQRFEAPQQLSPGGTHTPAMPFENPCESPSVTVTHHLSYPPPCWGTRLR